MKTAETKKMISDNEFLFLPLGGAEEIGMNLNLYAYDDKWLMVDLGISFADNALPGVEVIMPDTSFIEKKRKKLLGLVLTHGHEDHLGAVQYLWPRLRCPIYATGFTAALLRAKLQEMNFSNEVDIHEVELGASFTLGPFDLKYVTVTHSIPEPNALVIKTKLGTVMHTGDFKIDDTPVVGNKIDIEAMESIGADGVLAMICDSTNVFNAGESGSEGALRDSLNKIISGRKGKVAITTFASNLARIRTAAWVAKKNGRHPVLVGRSLWRILGVARDSGYGGGLNEFLDERDAVKLPSDKVLFICTGSQGESRGAMTRIAECSHPNVKLGAGDLVIFSSKIIPGNEKTISRLHNQLISLGIKIVTEKENFVHVSGHPSRDELAKMYSWIRPEVAIPVHGETRHIVEHAALARSLQVPKALESFNGSVIRLSPGPVEIVDSVVTGRLASDGSRLITVDSQIFRERRRLMYNGIINAVLVLDKKRNLVSSPTVNSRGVFAEDAAIDIKLLKEEITAAYESLPLKSLKADEKIEEAVRIAIRRKIRKKYEIRPDIAVNLVHL